jgi:hypothetical protein
MNAHPRFGVAAMLLALGASLLGVPRLAGAQTAGSASGQIEARVGPGTEVMVETIDGRKIQGRLRSVSEAGLLFDKVGAPPIPTEDIRTVSRRSGRRPVLKGLVVGLAAGAGLGLAVMVSDRAQHQRCTPDELFCGVSFGPSAEAIAGVFTVLGAGVGAGVGALIPAPMKVVYRASSPPRVSIGPIITSVRRGVALSVVF